MGWKSKVLSSRPRNFKLFCEASYDGLGILWFFIKSNEFMESVTFCL